MTENDCITYVALLCVNKLYILGNILFRSETLYA